MGSCLLLLDDPAPVLHRPDPSLIFGVLHLEIPQRGIAEVTRRRPVADVQVLARPVCSRVRRGRLGHARARFLAADGPSSLVDVSNGRGDGQNDVRIVVLVRTASFVFRSSHVSIGHHDVLGPLLARVTRIRASLVTTASTHAGGRADGNVTGA